MGIEDKGGLLDAPPGRAPYAADDGLDVDGVKEVLKDLIGRATPLAEYHRAKAKNWGNTFFLVGLPASALAGAAGVTALLSTAGRIPAGIVAIIAGALGGVATFLDSATRERLHKDLAAGWQALANNAQLRLSLDVRNPVWVTLCARDCLAHLQDLERQLLEEKVPDERDYDDEATREAAIIASDAASRRS